MRQILRAISMIPLAAPLAAQVPVFPIDTVHVQVGSRASSALPVWTRGVEVITGEEIRRLPVRTIAEALQWAISLDVMPRSPAQVDVGIRGSSFEQILVLVDGVRMSDPQSGHFDLNLAVPLAQVERIEVLRGPASALYGSDAVGGVIQVVTRRDGPSSLRASGSTGSFGTTTFAAAARASGGAGWLDFAADQERSDGHRAGTDYRIRQIRLAAGSEPARRPLRAELAIGQRDFGADRFYAAFPSYEETRTTVASLAWTSPAESRSGLDLRASFRRHGDDFVLRRDDPGFYRNLHTSRQYGADLVARAEPATGIRLAGGVEAVREELESSNLGDRGESRTAAFGELALAEGAIALNLGLRGDWYARYGGFVAPSLAGAWWLSSRVRARASAGRAFRAPSWTERYYEDPQNIGDPDLAPERAWNAEAGLELTASRSLRLGFAGWVRSSDELIDWARPTGSTEPWRTRNVGDARFEGIEADASGSVAATLWTASAALIRFSSSAADGFTSKYALRPMTRSYSLGLVQPLPFDLELSGRLRYGNRAGMDSDPGSTCVEGAAERRTEIDGRLSHRRDRVHLFLDVRNATDTFGCDIIAQPTAGRGLFVGVAWGG
jgi:vitamin B12 transporter